MKNSLTKIDITHIPFSRYGAYVSVTKEAEQKELTVHFVQRRFGEAPALTLSFGPEGADDFVCSADPEKITVETGKGRVILYLRDDMTLAAVSNGAALLWKMVYPNGYGTECSERRFRMFSVNQRFYMNFLVEKGEASMPGPLESRYDRIRNKKQFLKINCEDGQVRMAVRFSRMDPQDVKGSIAVREDLNTIRSEWEGFLAKLPAHSGEDEMTENFRRVTWFNLWSCYVRAEDCYHSDTMLMAKKFMSSVWSWDHCFNALAVAGLGKEKAMEQFEAAFVLQSPKGALPDMWNPHTEIVWGVTKPPIHGWCFSKLMDRYEFTRTELIRVYGYLEKWTNWWFTENDPDSDGIPSYPQGCDSGWDNSTLFDIGFHLESPDLPAFLILQMKVLKRISDALTGWNEKAVYWEKRAEELTEKFYEHSWNGERFVAKLSGSHEYEEHPTSLLSLMPLVLGDTLEKEKFEKLVTILKRDFLTENGLATEMPESKKYEPDGYWRGPIWAPTTYLLVDGLRRGGETKLAETIAERYCRMSERKAFGNYENFDALTGKGLRAPGYTWSASVYMLLKEEYRISEGIMNCYCENLS